MLKEEDIENLGEVSGFPKKLFKIIHNPENNELISWNKEGTQFTIFNPNEFSEKILGNSDMISSSNYSSFIRQLNMYGFHKVKTKTKSRSDTYYHIYFQRDRPSLLKNIKRKPNNSGLDEDNQLQISNFPYREDEYDNMTPGDNRTDGNMIDKYYSYKTKMNFPNCKLYGKKPSKAVLQQLYTTFLKEVNFINLAQKH